MTGCYLTHVSLLTTKRVLRGVRPTTLMGKYQQTHVLRHVDGSARIKEEV
jgi:hypothetical protein